MFFQLFGFLIFQLPALKIIDMRCANDSFTDVLKAFWQEDRITIVGSGVILVFQWVTHGAIHYYNLPIANRIFEFDFWPLSGMKIPFIGLSLGLALLLGFCGQAILYGALGKAGDYIKNKFGTK